MVDAGIRSSDVIMAISYIFYLVFQYRPTCSDIVIIIIILSGGDLVRQVSRD